MTGNEAMNNNLVWIEVWQKSHWVSSNTATTRNGYPNFQTEVIIQVFVISSMSSGN